MKLKRLLSTSIQEIRNFNNIPSDSRIFSLIQPTGKIHLGNYLGAVKNWKTLSNLSHLENKCIFGVADLHAITIPKLATELKEYRYQAIASLLSSGLDDSQCILYFQSSVPEHTELNWYLTCITSMGQLNRMTQWKSKAKQGENSTITDDKVLESTKAGLLCYPILQIADVLIYKSTHVPVGDDQSQHLELCRDVAERFNSIYQTDYFPIPKTILTSNKKILSLKNPNKKMSKSDPNQNSCVYITDSPEAIKMKIKKATTDSIQGQIYFDPEERPGVSNLINIVAGIKDLSIDETVNEMSHLKDHKQLKDYVSEIIIEEFTPMRLKYNEFMNNKDYLTSIVNKGKEHAKEIAEKNIKEIRTKIGMD
ncbi:unnamed protein product [Candida verbasci]|uniref:Tryptophan--tRNA ligase, mitochondrial n=1 Tax=Candida verbasci TaxID=1227364 RepID=A0A9W4XI75_9ASCO|nr:unnamed protein product [Candida verbasci]